MQKDFIFKIRQFYSAKKIPDGIRIRLENHFPQLETSKKPSFSTEIFQKSENWAFSEILEKVLMKVSSKSHRAGNLKKFFMLAQRFVSSKNWGGLQWKQIRKSRIEKGRS